MPCNTETPKLNKAPNSITYKKHRTTSNPKVEILNTLCNKTLYGLRVLCKSPEPLPASSARHCSPAPASRLLIHIDSATMLVWRMLPCSWFQEIMETPATHTHNLDSRVLLLGPCRDRRRRRCGIPDLPFWQCFGLGLKKASGFQRVSSGLYATLTKAYLAECCLTAIVYSYNTIIIEVLYQYYTIAYV